MILGFAGPLRPRGPEDWALERYGLGTSEAVWPGTEPRGLPLPRDIWEVMAIWLCGLELLGRRAFQGEEFCGANRGL